MKIDQIIKQYDRIFIDHSTLLSPGGQFLLNELLNFDILDFNGANHLVITNESLKTLNEHTPSTKLPYLINTLKKLSDEKLLQFKNFNGEPYQIIFDKFLHRYSLVLITNDKTIADQVINYKYGENSRPMAVFSLNRQIQLESYITNPKIMSTPNEQILDTKKSNTSQHANNASSQESFESPIESEDFFEIKPTEEGNVDPFSKQFLIKPVQFKGIEKHDLPLQHDLPQITSELLTSSKQKIVLTSLLSDKGGEGIIYNTNIKNYVCKIYRKNVLTKHKFEKLELLASKPMIDPRIAYPRELVFYKDKFVGYIMPRVNGFFVGDFMFGVLSSKKFKNWTRVHLLELCISILSVVDKAHSHGLLIGDVNRGNFMVESPRKVYMVDVDSVQVEKYPCPVGVEEFTAPEIIDGEYSYKEFFRTYENEYYSLAVLIFMILMMGTATTSQLNNHSSLSKVQKIKQQDFGFTLDEDNSKKRQNPINFAMWSRFPSYIKEAFYHTFHKNGKYNKPKNRLSPKKWIELLNSYRYHLTSGHLSCI